MDIGRYWAATLLARPRFSATTANRESGKNLSCGDFTICILRSEQDAIVLKSPRICLVDARRSRIARKEIRALLGKARPKGLSRDQLWKLLRKRLGRRMPSDAELSRLLTSVACVERLTVNGRVRNRVYCRDSPGDTYERILRRAGEPMHFTDICAATRQVISRSKPLNPKVVAVQLGADPRFTAMAHSGYWALSAWPNVETRGIADIAAALLADAKRPMKVGTLSTIIARLRPVAAKSVTATLHNDSRFQRVGRGIWTIIDRTRR